MWIPTILRPKCDVSQPIYASCIFVGRSERPSMYIKCDGLKSCCGFNPSLSVLQVTSQNIQPLFIVLIPTAFSRNYPQSDLRDTRDGILQALLEIYSQLSTCKHCFFGDSKAHFIEAHVKYTVAKRVITKAMQRFIGYIQDIWPTQRIPFAETSQNTIALRAARFNNFKIIILIKYYSRHESNVLLCISFAKLEEHSDFVQYCQSYIRGCSFNELSLFNDLEITVLFQPTLQSQVTTTFEEKTLWICHRSQW